MLQTGTLTEDGMDFWGLVPSLNGCFLEEVEKTSELVRKLPVRMLEGMATCHSLTYIDDELVGDPLELKVRIIFSILLPLQTLFCVKYLWVMH
jgi:cation-transporting ATPase 13A3/4/5